MEKEFIPYNLALELKKLGFDEPCFGYYEPNGDLDYIERNILKDFPYLAKNSEWEDLCGAPTFSQAFRFFREKYNIESHIKSLYQQRENKGFYFGIDDYIKKDFYSSPYYSYEEAELECLKKLIEIVKAEKL